MDSKYSTSVLISILDMGPWIKNDLLGIVKSPNTLDKLLDGLKVARLIELKVEIRGRRTYFITLTPKGTYEREMSSNWNLHLAASVFISFIFPLYVLSVIYS